MILVDGQQTGVVPADDRGLAYGDGVFETIEVRHGRPVLWQRHWRRLAHGCDVLKLACPDVGEMSRECLTVIQGQDRGIIKIIVTRGSGGRGYRPAGKMATRRIVSWHDWPDYPAHYASSGVKVLRCQTPVSENPSLAGLKTLCRIEQVLAQMEWEEPEYAEGLMFTASGELIEGTRTNVFIARNGQLLTPGLKRAGIKGIMRDVIIEMAIRDGLEVKETVLTHTDVLAADEVFLCNSILKIWPVRMYLDKQYQAGVFAKTFMERLSNHAGDYE